MVRSRHRAHWATVLTLLAATGCASSPPPPGASAALTPADSETRDMRLVGHDGLQARSAYQPVIQKQGNRWIAYVGHHGGRAVNPMTGKEEPHGTSILDVTDPKNPRRFRGPNRTMSSSASSSAALR